MAEHVAVMVTDASVRECVMYGNLHIRGEDTRSIGTRLTVEISKAFDAWLEALKRTERAAAWDEGYDSGVYEGGKTVDGWGLNSGHDTEAERDNPYRIERGE